MIGVSEREGEFTWEWSHAWGGQHWLWFLPAPNTILEAIHDEATVQSCIQTF